MSVESKIDPELLALRREQLGSDVVDAQIRELDGLRIQQSIILAGSPAIFSVDDLSDVTRTQKVHDFTRRKNYTIVPESAVGLGNVENFLQAEASKDIRPIFTIHTPDEGPDMAQLKNMTVFTRRYYQADNKPAFNMGAFDKINKVLKATNTPELVADSTHPEWVDTTPEQTKALLQRLQTHREEYFAAIPPNHKDLVLEEASEASLAARKRDENKR